MASIAVCPLCQGELVPGLVRFRNTKWGMIIDWGLTSFLATFTSDKGKRRTFLAPWRRKPARACVKCHAVVLAPARLGHGTVG